MKQGCVPAGPIRGLLLVCPSGGLRNGVLPICNTDCSKERKVKFHPLRASGARRRTRCDSPRYAATPRSSSKCWNTSQEKTPSQIPSGRGIEGSERARMTLFASDPSIFCAVSS